MNIGDLYKAMAIKRKKAFFSISAVAKMFSVHQQTIRLYERQGLICPKRSEGNTRLFSEEDVNRLEEVIYLTHQLGINLAGVEMILKLKRQIKKMQKDMNKVFETTERELDKRASDAQHAVLTSSHRLANLQKTTKPTAKDPSGLAPYTESVEDDTEPADTLDQWKIDYEQP